MGENVYTPDDFQIKPHYYQWTGYVLSLLEKILKVNIKLHADEEQIAAGDIFLFNHFARFETAIPPYLIHKASGCMSRSVAAPEFFHANDAASAFLRGLGAVPNDFPDIIPYLASEIVLGRKVVVFPEGGMVKDRRVLDRRGHYSVYSRTAHERRKHHLGAAVIGVGLEVYREAIRRSRTRGDDAKLDRWSARLGEGGREKLYAFAERETRVVPANITFYPIRVDDNLFQRTVGMLAGGDADARMMEELRIEGNILLKDTDMDIRLSEATCPCDFWNVWDRLLAGWAADRINDLEDIFTYGRRGPRRWGGLRGRLFARRNRRTLLRMRDSYMHDMYASVSVHMSHLASLLIMNLLEAGEREVARERFHTLLYLFTKEAQRDTDIRLHRSLVDLEYYDGMLDGDCRDLDQFLETTERLGLVERDAQAYRFTDRLDEELHFDEVRVENPVAVYDNEVEPIVGLDEAYKRARKQVKSLGGLQLAELRFDDELRSLEFDRNRFSKPQYAEINERQTFTEDPSPFLLVPKRPRHLGVLAIHGFTASPAEVRGLGEQIAAEGYPVLGVRLRGHGTSPWDLRERGWDDWVASVARGAAILSGFCDEVALVGFSMGGLLALHHAATHGDGSGGGGVRGVVSVCAPMKLRDKGMMLVPLIHSANRLVRTLSPYEGVKPFHASEPEHPGVNYRHMPIRALNELDRFIGETQNLLPDVRCPVLVLQSDGDPTVAPESGEMIYEKLSVKDKVLTHIHTDKHGILYEDIGNARQRVVDFIKRLETA